MALDHSVKIDIPEHGCVLQKNGKYTYVYYAVNIYRNEKGQPTCDRISIGRYDEESGKLIPNRNYYEVYKKEPANLPASVENYGTYAVMNAIGDKIHLNKLLKEVFPDTYQQILTTAQFMLLEGNSMYLLPEWQDDNVTFFKKRMTTTQISDLFKSISADDRRYFFQEWIKKAQNKEFVAYDVTSISSYSKNIPELEWGYNRDKEDIPQINLAMYYGENTGTPYYYRIYPGSITDKTHLSFMIDDTDLGKKIKVYFVMDRGFYSKDNLVFLVDKGCRFLMAIPSDLKFLNELIDKYKNEIVNCYDSIIDEDNIIYGKSVICNEHGFRMKVHIFYDPIKAAQDMQILKTKIKKLGADLAEMTEIPGKNTNYAKYFRIEKDENGRLKYTENHESINKSLGRCGMFAIADTVFSKTTKEVLDIYRRRDTIEKAFDDLKNAEGMGRTYTHSTAALEGKAFVAFIALIYRSYILQHLRDYMKKKNYTFKKISVELNKIRQCYSPTMPNNARLQNPVTKTQREILEGLGFDEKLVQ